MGCFSLAVILPFALFASAQAFSLSNPSSVRLATTSLQASSVACLEDSNLRSLFSSDKPVLIDAYAPWCGPCKLIAPVVERCAEKHADDIVVAGFDVESKNQQVKTELLLQGVLPRALPFLILMHKGKPIGTHTGVISEEGLDEFLEKNLSEALSETKSVPEQEESEQAAGFINFAAEATADDYMLVER